MAQNKRQKLEEIKPHIAQLTAMANSTAGSSISSNKNENKMIFNQNLADFRDAVKWSGFVDRSLLIKELLSEIKPKSVLIFAPRRFGKSMNVNMVKRFFEIEEGRNIIEDPQDLKELENFENFKAFNRYGMKNPCNILAEKELVKQHFGRHPVVYLSFKDGNVSSSQHVENGIRGLVHCAYREHSYLKGGKIFSDPNRDEDATKSCRLWCDPEKYINQNAILGLKFLIRYLHNYHKRQVYLLVDEFDAPAINALLAKKSGDEVNNFSSQVTQLISAIVKANVGSEHLLGSLITGVSHLGGVGISNYMNNIPVYKWLLDHTGRFAPYYGLSDAELLKLLKDVFPKDDQIQISIQEEVKKLYNGYTFKDENVYCLWSVLFYIEARSKLKVSEIPKKSFWGGTNAIISTLGSLLRDRYFMDKMIQVMNIESDGCISFTPCDTVRAQDLAEFLNNNECIVSHDVVVSFFVEQGYLTPYQRENVSSHVNVNVIDNTEIYVKIPNLDVLVAFQQMFKDYCLRFCGLSDGAMIECAQIFKNLPTERNDEIFKEKLRYFYNCLQLLLGKFNGQDVNERSLQAALYTTMLKIGFQECSMEKIVHVGSRTGNIDQWLLDDTFACILEEKVVESVENDSRCKKSARGALEEILYGSKVKKVPYVKILNQYPEIQNYVLIGICMSGKGETFMCCLVNSVNIEDCIVFPKDN